MVDVIPFTTKSLKTMVDGTVRLSIDIDPANAQDAFKLFGMPGVAGAICRLTDEASQSHLQHKTINDERLYGEEAKELKLSGFFRTPEVWRSVGSDNDFLSWLRDQPCAARTITQQCMGDIVAAHVRRVSGGAGTGIKPAYSAISMCDYHHQMQHNEGESVFGGKEWFDKKRIDALQNWCWGKLKADLGFESWSQINPEIMKSWVREHGLEQYLPAKYQ